MLSTRSVRPGISGLKQKKIRRARKTLAGRKIARIMVPRLKMRTHHFKQVFYPGTGSVTVAGTMTYPSAGNLIGPTTGGAADGQFTIYFQIADLPQVSSFSSLFDEYRVNRVVYKFDPVVQQTSYTTLTTDVVDPFQVQYLNTVIDFDDATIVTSMSSMMEYETFRKTSPGRKTVRTFIPSISNEVYRTGGGTIGYGRKSKQWIDLAYTDVPHYGIKGYVDHYANKQVQQHWKVTCTAYISFRQVR